MNRTVMLLVMVLGVILSLTGCTAANNLYCRLIIYPIYDRIAYPAQIGPWVNIYKGDPALAGIYVQQYPEGEGARVYAHQHPEMILYYFWDGSIRHVEYSEDGKITQDVLWPKDRHRPESGIWYGVDFSYGSDPHFQHHKDPRIVDKKRSLSKSSIGQ